MRHHHLEDKALMEKVDPYLAYLLKMISLLLCAAFVVWVVYMVGRLSERIEQGPKLVKLHSDMATCQDDLGQRSLQAAECQRALLDCQNADGRFAAYLERY